MQVRRLNSSSVAKFLEFRSEGLEADADAFRFNIADDLAISSSTWSERLDRDFVVAAVDDRTCCVGIGGLAKLCGRKLDHKGLIWGMYVTPAARGTGAADLILSTLLQEACTSLRQVQLTVIADNLRARALYERHGFRTYGIEPASVRRGNCFMDEALMALVF